MHKPIFTLLSNLNLPPINEWNLFEDFVAHFFNELENCNSYKRFGVQGQSQFGFDIISTSKKTAIQCKVKKISGGNKVKIRKELIRELKSDFKSFQNYKIKNKLDFNRFIFASTFDSDTHITTECAKLSSKQINVEYWSWDDFRSQMPDETFTSYFNELIPYINGDGEGDGDSRLDSFTSKNQYKFDENEPLLNQLYNYFKFLFSEIDIVPIQFLKNSYPFKVSQDFFPYYSGLTLTTDNIKLFDLFESFIIEENNLRFINNEFSKGVENANEKLIYILKKLSNHFIFNIQLNGSGNSVSTRISDSSICDCERCTFDKLQYLATFKSLAKEPEDINKKFLKAYMHYKLGNYMESALMFEELSNDTKTEKQYSRHAIAEYNLSKLYVFVRSNYWGKNENSKLLNRLKNKSIDNLTGNIKDAICHKIVDWILNSSFYTSKLEGINKNANKIRDHYYSQRKGGWSQNNNLLLLINDYAEIELFLKGNCIIFDKFNEFKELTNTFIEGLFMSYSMSDNQGSKLLYFDDWLFSKMIFNGKPDKILSFFRRYELKTLKYKASSNQGETFLDIVNNHLTTGCNELFYAHKNSYNTENNNFWNYHDEIFCNLLLLLSISDIKGEPIKKMSKNLFNYFNESNMYNFQSIKYTQLFIYYKGEFIEKTVLYDFLNLFLSKNRFHENTFIESLITQIKNNHDILETTEQELEKLFSIVFGECDICKRNHSSEIITLYYDAVSSRFKDKIKNRITEELENDFDADLYYMSVIYNVFDCSDEFFNKYVEYSKQSSSNLNIQSVITGVKNNRMHQVNKLLDMCFKNNVDLSEIKFEFFKNIDDYYSWLFDLKSFNYEKFDPKWTTECRTKYFLNEFKKHPIIKDKVLEYLKTNQDYLVEKVLISIA